MGEWYERIPQRRQRSPPPRGKSITEKRQSAYEERLAFMQNLAHGDFATVKRQCLLLGEDLSPEEWLGQLEIEVATKRRSKGDEDTRQRLH